MPRKKIFIRTCWFALCVLILIAAPAMIAVKNAEAGSGKEQMDMLTVWQIDSFEGGKGSRAGYLQTVGDNFSKDSGCYVRVVSITAEAARQNLVGGTVPDLISYGAGTYGLENYITGKPAASVWAYGGYCIISTDERADFEDVSVKNSVINGGTGNLSGAAALFCGLNGATVEKPTNAYVSLINGKYKYLLGTQRDIYRMVARGATFKVKPLTDFNDLYQLISITAQNTKNCHMASEFISYLSANDHNLNKIGMMGKTKLYDDEMSQMENLEYGYTLKSPVSEEMKNSLDDAINKSNINLLKNLLK